MPISLPKFTPAALALALWSGLACADQLHVPSQYPTIQEAIDAAVDGDEIVIAAGTYRELLDGQNKSLTYTGAGMGLTILSGDLDDDGVPDGTVLRINNISSQPSPTLTFQELTVRDGVQGVVVSLAGHVTLTRCTFESCDVSPNSKALNLVSWADHTLMVNGCVFEGNGRALVVDGFATVDIRNSDFRGHVNRAVTLEDHESLIVASSNFYDNLGGAIDIYDIRSVEVMDSTFEGNIAGSSNNEHGAAVSNYRGNVSQILFERCVFVDNHAGGGGAVELDAGRAEIRDTLFSQNTAGIVVSGSGLGGAVGTYGPTLIVEECEFTNNAGAESGPLNVAVDSNSDSRIVGCTFTKNGRNLYPDEMMYTKGGGALCIESGEILVDNCLFRENHAQSAGAIMLLSQAFHPVIQNCRFYANYASEDGGAIYGAWDRAEITGCEFIGNTSGYRAGAVSSPSGDYRRSPSMDSCVFYASSAPSGAIGLSNGDPPNITNSILAVQSRYNLFANDNGQLLIPLHASNLVAINHESIGFVRLPSDGGDGWGDDLSTPGVDEGANDDFGDLRLLPGSPAIDAGDNSAIPLDDYDIDNDGDITEPITGPYDLDGNPRFVDAPGMPNLYPGTDVGGPIDLGPYEFQGVSCWADVNTDGVLSPADFTAWIAAYNTHTPRADQNRDGDLNPADFTAWIANYNSGC